MQKIDPSVKDLGEFKVERFIPSPKVRMVGPFVFFDHLPKASFDIGKGINVRPHPHTGLSTVTYLFEGEILHRDSLGSVQPITPGAINWMTAGRGIVHSERDTHEARSRQSVLHALQAWVALPRRNKNVEPSFTHVAKHDLPVVYPPGQMVRVLAGEAHGVTAPINRNHCCCDILYVDIVAKAETSIDIASYAKINDSAQDLTEANSARELAILVVGGELSVCDTEAVHASASGTELSAGDLFYVAAEDTKQLELQVKTDARVVLFGGAKWDEKPILEWNFLAWSIEEMQGHKQRWKSDEFPTIPYDDLERIPLPSDKSKTA